MQRENGIAKSLVEQILDEMFANIEKREELNSQLIQELKQLAGSGGLRKPDEVANAIKPASEATHEGA